MDKTSLKKNFLLVTYAILLFMVIYKFNYILTIVGNIIDIFNPLILGIAIAFVLNIIMRSYENRFLNKLGEKYPKFLKFKRASSVFLTLLTVAIAITLIMLFIFPPLVKNFKILSNSIPGYANEISLFFEEFIGKYELTESIWAEFGKNIDSILSNIGHFVSTFVPQIVNFTMNLTTGIIDIFLGIIFAIYMLFSKEKLIHMLKKVLFAFVNIKYTNKIIGVLKDANLSFSQFISGQLTEAFILGSLCFIGMSLFKMPYAPLVGVMVGTMSLIPILGAYIGTAIGAFLILLEQPSMVLWFVLFIIILQQIEGNLIYPKVVGNAIGLSGMWVLLAIVVGGGLMGITGMLLAVPTMAVIYNIVRRITNKRLNKKGIEVAS